MRLAPIKPREIADSIVYGDELERCDTRFRTHSTCDVAVRETYLEFVTWGKVMRRFRRCEQRVPSSRPKKEESHAGLRGAVVSSLQQAEPNLIAAWYVAGCKQLGHGNDNGVTVERRRHTS